LRPEPLEGGRLSEAVAGVTDRAAAVAEAFNRGLLTPAKPDR
jgi:hypothetical protein